jgi:YhcH/YjgK/YiaL family protein
MQNARYEISAGIYAQVFMSQIRQEKDRHLETHHDFVDIQFVIDGYDIIGIKDAKSCNEIFINYDPSKDIAFFNEKPDYEIKLLSNHFIVIFPDEAHCPESADIIAKKVVVKVKKELFENVRS